MNCFKHLVASVALMGALAGPACAQGESAGITNDTATFISPSGAVFNKKITDTAMQNRMMEHAMPMTAGVMMMMHGGKMYHVPDKKMPDGKMLSDMMMAK